MMGRPGMTAARRGMIAKVHVAKKDLCLGDEDYRQTLMNLFGVESSKDLNGHQLSRLLNHFVSRGWKPKMREEKPAKGDFVEIPDSDPDARQKRYVLGLWAALGYEPGKLNARVKRQFGVDHIRFLRDQADLQVLVNDLVNRCKRAGIDPDPAA
jgi:hypothetical protein